MTRHYSLLVTWSCITALALSPIAALFFLINIDAFANLAKHTLALSIQWSSVTNEQWYSLWFLTALYAAIGLTGIYFLRRAFVNFSRGEFFNQSNSRDLRLFSIFLFIQAAAKPLYFALSSVILSFNHPAGQKMLSILVGSGEIKVIILAMILWVISDLLVKSGEIERENKQFI